MIAARAFLLALLVCWGFTASADVAVPPLSGRVVDQTGTLSSDTIASLTQTLKGLELRKGSQVAVLIVPTTAPETIEQYSIRVAETWKIGRKKIDDGALLVVAKDDHKLRIEVGYGLEGSLTDATASRIISEVITPKFRSGDFAGGISDGVERIIGVIDGEPLPAPEPQQSYDSPGRIDMLFNPLILFGVFVAGGLLRTLLGRLIGAVATGGVVGLLVWFFVGSLALSIILAIGAAIFSLFASSAASNARTGGWSGGGGSFSSGGSSSSSGGFSGGGGSFGGGGASGSW
jgi:uncharacterized protein